MITAYKNSYFKRVNFFVDSSVRYIYPWLTTYPSLRINQRRNSSINTRPMAADDKKLRGSRRSLIRREEAANPKECRFCADIGMACRKQSKALPRAVMS